MAEKIQIASLDIDVDAVIKESQRLQHNIDALKESQKQLKKEGQTTSKQYQEQAAQLKNLSKSYRDNQKFASALLDVNSDLADTLRVEGKSTAELLDSRRKLNEISKKLTGNSDAEIKLRSKLNKAIDEQTAQLREQQSEYNASKDRIGEYKQAINEAIPSNTLLGRSISGVRDGLNVLTPIMGAFTDGVKDGVKDIKNFRAGTEGLTKAQKAQAIATNLGSGALKIFKAALISTGIGAIVVALGSLVTFLASTQKGIDAVNKVLKPMEVIFNRLFGKVQEFGEAIFDAFSNPKKLIKDVGEAIKTNIINRFEALGRIAQRVMNFDFDGIGDDFIQAGTGVSNFTEKMKNAAKATKDFFAESVELGNKLAQLQVDIERGEINLIKRRSELQLITKEQNKIAEDVTKNEAERAQAAQTAIDAQTELLRLEQAQLDKQIEKMKIEQSLNDTTREDEKELAELEARRNEIATQVAEQQTTLQNKLNTIRDQSLRKIEAQRKAETDRAKNAIGVLETELEIWAERNKSILDLDGELHAARVDASIAAAMTMRDRELDILKEKHEAGLISDQEYQLARLQTFNEFNSKRDALEEEYQKQQAEKQAERDQAEKEKAALEEEARLEVRLLKAQEQAEFEQLQLDARKERELEAARKIGADTTAIEEKYALLSQRIQNQKEIGRVQTLQNALGQFGQLTEQFFGENKDVQVALALTDTFLAAQKAYLSQLIPGDPTSVPRAIGAAIQASAFGLANVAKIKGVKFADGGLQEIGGKSHAAGGTKFVGEDGTHFEAERGELIGVMNKKAAGHFMAFNNMFRDKTSRSGYYAGGGLLGSASSMVQGRFDGSSPGGGVKVQGIDYDLLAGKIAEANMHLPNPVVGVDEISSVKKKVEVIEQGANV